MIETDQAVIVFVKHVGSSRPAGNMSSIFLHTAQKDLEARLAMSRRAERVLGSVR